ncbi:hypothetical protein ACN6K4_003315 [Streptomyces hayashii]|uniref:hypothetical protein n=1 Tax=Streptomyces hayashii TaxID=2839966 RepID=UPI00403C27F3
MPDNMHQPVTASAAAHAQRIKAGEQTRKRAAGEREGRQTFEVYAERARAGAAADEALREEARKNELRARGRWVPGEEEDVEEGDEAEEVEGSVDPTDNPERRSARAAWKSASTGGYLAL